MFQKKRLKKPFFSLKKLHATKEIILDLDFVEPFLNGQCNFSSLHFQGYNRKDKRIYFHAYKSTVCLAYYQIPPYSYYQSILVLFLIVPRLPRKTIHLLCKCL